MQTDVRERTGEQDACVVDRDVKAANDTNSVTRCDISVLLETSKAHRLIVAHDTAR